MSLDPQLFSPEAIDPETRKANETLEKLLAQVPAVNTQTPQAIRAAREAGQGTFGPIVRLPHAEERTIRGPAGPLPLRVLRPRSGPVRGIYFHIHGGGHVLGSHDAQDVMLDQMANRAGVIAVSVGYRLAPEHPYPAAPNDCEAAALWLVENARRELGAERFAIGGESAGAHLAAVTAIRLRDRHALTPFCAANLVYGVYDLTFTPSVRSWGERNLVLSTPIIEWFANHFIPDRAQRGTSDASPLYADLRGLPPALFTVGTLDPLLDDSLFMAARWAAAGNRAELAIYPGGVHGFNLFPMPLAARANQRAQAFVAEAFH
ncbi:MAG TPA: alpha/beta hydrolase [Myxococcota bacterium]|nr:alpha/beta hydrolase [Myxococcota bacterium]